MKTFEPILRTKDGRISPIESNYDMKGAQLLSIQIINESNINAKTNRETVLDDTLTLGDSSTSQNKFPPQESMNTT